MSRGLFSLKVQRCSRYLTRKTLSAAMLSSSISTGVKNFSPHTVQTAHRRVSIVFENPEGRFVAGQQRSLCI
jgi:hypothetical protein